MSISSSVVAQPIVNTEARRAVERPERGIYLPLWQQLQSAPQSSSAPINTDNSAPVTDVATCSDCWIDAVILHAIMGDNDDRC